VLRQIRSQPGEYRLSLPNDQPGRHEIRIAEGEGVEGTTLPYRVELPAGHELDDTGLGEETLRTLAAASGGAFYREEDLSKLVDAIQPRTQSFVQRQEVLLWNSFALVLFVVVITAEWLLRKFSNLS
jgi:hypothetical protein